MKVFTKRFLFGLILGLLMPVAGNAQQTSSNAKLEQLQTEMYRLFYKEDSLAYRKVLEELKEEALRVGNDEEFYKAWGNNAIYESTHQRRTQALAIAREMEDYAEEHKSIFGQYTAIHVMGTVYHQMRDYDNAEKTFKDAIDFLHKNSPDQSAAADYIELILISVNGRVDVKQGMAYAERALKEPNVSAQHRMRVLTMLCQLEGEKANPDKDVFNHFYEERLQVRAGTPPDRAEATVNMLYHFVNGNYDRALVYSDSLSTPDQITYAKARIYHEKGDDSRAYQQMLAYKTVKDSMNLAERTGLLSEYIIQLNNERLSLRNMELEKQNAQLRNWFVAVVVLLVILLLVMGSTFVVRKLRRQNVILGKAHQEEKEARIAEHKARKEVEMELDIKREFVNNIAQELRSPLNPIAGFSDILADGSIKLQPEEREMMSSHIKANSKVLTDLIDHMIELSFYESKKSLPKNDTFSPNVVCQNAIDFTNIHLLKDKPNVGAKLKSELPDTFDMKSDFHGVDKVIRELLRNAAKFTDGGGILLNVMETENGMVRFMVSDTGSGIGQDYVDHIFHPHVQKEHDVKMTGMGLSICNRIAKLLGGTLTYDDTYRSGSRFIFDVPKV